MKRILSLMLAISLILFSLITVSAEPMDPTRYVMNYFEKLYDTIEDDLQLQYDNCNFMVNYGSNDYKHDYYCIMYTSSNPINAPYYYRFGENNEYYEYSEVTNLLFQSGIVIFRGHTHSFPENHNDDFYSLEEIIEYDPLAINWVMEKYGPERVGYIGDSDCDGEVTILDATAIQRHLAQLDTLKIELASDIDDNGYVDITDATNLQLKLANLE